MTRTIRVLLIIVLGIIAFWFVLWTLVVLSAAGNQNNNGLATTTISQSIE